MITAHTAIDLERACKVLGIENLRPAQEEAIQSVLQDKHTLTVLPTGYGKTVIFQLPALMSKGVTVVFSPLIALMSDQVAKLGKVGIPARALHSGIQAKAQDRAMADIKAGQVKFVYCAPERLNRSDFVGALQALPIARIVVDEAHVMDEWEGDFRPAYAKIGEAVSQVHPRSVIAAPAPAGPRTVRVIEASLGIRFTALHVLPPDRDNLTYRVVNGGSWASIREFLHDQPTGHRGAIYCSTVREVEKLFASLQPQAKQRLGKYHGQMAINRREAIQEAFGKNEVDVMVCTNAFGLGIDYPDLRFVVHTGLCTSLDQYVQEQGRAGRDGKPSTCVLFVPPDARSTPEYFLKIKNPTVNHIKAVFMYYATHKASVVRDSASLVAREALGHESQEPIVNTCKAVLRRANLINTWRDPAKARTVTFLANPRTLNLPWRADKQALVLRVYDWIDRWGERDGETVRLKIESLVAAMPEIPETRLVQYLLDLKKVGALDVEADATQYCTRVQTREFKIDEDELEEKRKNDWAKYTAMLEYASYERSTDEAREFIRSYFQTEEMQLRAMVDQTPEAMW